MTAIITGTDTLDILQYSKDKSLTFTDYSDATEVQFIKGKSSVLATTITNGVALIPNQLLSGEVAGRLKFQVVNSEGTVIYENYLNVLKDNIPSDYVLKGTECKTYQYYGGGGNANIDFSTVGTSLQSGLFYRYINSINIKELDTSEFTDMNSMFYYMDALLKLDLSNFNTSKVTNMLNMFVSCSKLKTIDLSSFDTSAVKNMSGMFSGCSSLETLNLSNFNTQNVTDMNTMFYSCSKLTSLNLSNFNTQKVTNMRRMFDTCTKLTSLNLSNFNTQKVTTMEEMFFYNNSLISLDLSNFDTSEVKNMKYMFHYCSSLTSLTLGSDWGINTSITSFNLSSCPLTHDSCLDVFNKLADKTQTATTSATLNLNATTKALMSADEIKIATDKGWTVS